MSNELQQFYASRLPSAKGDYRLKTVRTSQSKNLLNTQKTVVNQGYFKERPPLSNAKEMNEELTKMYETERQERKIKEMISECENFRASRQGKRPITAQAPQNNRPATSKHMTALD